LIVCHDLGLNIKIDFFQILRNFQGIYKILGM